MSKPVSSTISRVAAAGQFHLDQQTLQAAPIALGTGVFALHQQNVQPPVHQTERGDVDSHRAGWDRRNFWLSHVTNLPEIHFIRQGQNDLKLRT